MIAKDIITTDYAKIDKNAAISELIGELIRTKQKAAVVFDKNKYIGITTKRLLLKTKIDPAKLKVNKVIEKVPTLTGKEDLTEAARLLYTADAPILPIIEKGQVIGIIKSIDVINNLPQEEKNKKVNQIMTLTPITIKENDRTGKAIEIMRENKVSRIPIVDDKGDLLSITSITDFIEKHHIMLQGKAEQGVKSTGAAGSTGFSGEHKDMHAFPIKNITSPITITGKESDSVSNVINTMNEFNISSLVIVKENKPVGIVTIRDLLKLFIKDRLTL
jgi:CBS domain-containing protein